MIASVNFALFPSDELFTFTKRALTIVETKKDQIPGLEPFYAKTSETFALYQRALERETKNPFTLLLAAKDAVRDSAFMGFRTYIEAASYRAIPGWTDAANKILEIIRRHGWSAAVFGYKAETAAITNIISEVRNKCADELALIGANDWLNELEAAELDFDAVAHQSVNEAPAGEPTIVGVRPALTNSLRSLFSMIALLNSSTPSDTLTALETALSELIVRSLATVKAAGTRAENQKKDDKPKDPEK
jgi:hypothetical protein